MRIIACPFYSCTAPISIQNCNRAEVGCGVCPFCNKTTSRVRQKTFLWCELLDVLTIPTGFHSLTLRIRSLVL
jgi:hypothetical protein